VVDVFAALADPVRRSLLLDLVRRPSRVVDLAADRAITRPAVSRHLRVLTEAGLTTADDRGRERWYALRPDALAEVDRFTARLRDPHVPFPAETLDGLDLEVRRTGRDRRRARDAHDRRPTEETA
jgi:DNA-binding transcriptional ArsR family regulator